MTKDDRLMHLSNLAFDLDTFIQEYEFVTTGQDTKTVMDIFDEAYDKLQQFIMEVKRNQC